MTHIMHCVVAIGLLTAVSSAERVTAASQPVWSVGEYLHGKVNERGEREGNVSGMACAPTEGKVRKCLLIDDEVQGAQLVVIDGSRLIPGIVISLVTDTFNGKPVELDGEAVAYADGSFYVVGSHGRPRKSKKGEEGKPETPADKAKNDNRLEVSSHIFRVTLDKVDAATGKSGDGTTVVESAPLASFFPDGVLRAKHAEPLEVKPAANAGMTVEGFAVREADALVGFRGPIEGRAALILRVPLAQLFPPSGSTHSTAATMGVSPNKGMVMKVCLGTDGRGDPRGIRDLTVVGTTVYGIAGPVIDPPEDGHTPDYAIFRLPIEGRGEMRGLPETDPKLKPEALVPLDATESKFAGLLLFDGPVNGAPRSEVVDFSVAPAGGTRQSTDCPTVSGTK